MRLNILWLFSVARHVCYLGNALASFGALHLACYDPNFNTPHYKKGQKTGYAIYSIKNFQMVFQKKIVDNMMKVHI